MNDDEMIDDAVWDHLDNKGTWEQSEPCGRCNGGGCTKCESE